MSLKEFHQIENLFKNLGIDLIFVKYLALKQDNDKNQIYFGSGDSKSIFNLLPCRIRSGKKSESKFKKNSSKGKPKIEALFDFYWIDRETKIHKAPDAKLIYYFQYPEVRFSGFIKNCSNPPDCLRRKKQHIYGQRILVFGIDKHYRVIGIVLTEKEHPVVKQFPKLDKHCSANIFFSHLIPKIKFHKKIPSESLLDELKKIVKVWHKSQTLKKNIDGPIPFRGNQGAGYTLEALLGIERNSSKNPDYLGIEVKSFSKEGKISLMTPTADLGDESKLSFRDFMKKYGREGKKTDGSLRFTGSHKVGKKNNSTGLIMEVKGYDIEKDLFIGKDSDILVGLFQSSKNRLVSGWSLKKLFDNWIKKHAEAFYVEYEKKEILPKNNDHDYEYLFTGKIIYGMGTSINNYFKGICEGIVIYDPAHAIYSDNSTKQRPQWRVSVSSFIRQQNIKTFYDKVRYFDL